MTNRERWVVYPLLFFSLMMGLSEKLSPARNGTFNRLECTELRILSRAKQPILLAHESAQGSAVLQLRGLASTGYDVGLGGDDGSGPVDVKDWTDAKGRPKMRQLAELSGDIGGGYLILNGPQTFPELRLGHGDEQRISGMSGKRESGEVPIAVLSWDEKPEPDSTVPNSNADATDAEMPASSNSGETDDEDAKSHGEQTNGEQTNGDRSQDANAEDPSTVETESDD
ncbi:MAG: hypothetical protein KDA60_02335 [Planctomycetales bacterium]|nr:hypothetical protein [Planctomycetales bacterium]